MRVSNRMRAGSYDDHKKIQKEKEGAPRAMKTVRPKKKVIRRDLVPMKKLLYPRSGGFNQ